jgi:hypothetical protein
MARNASPKMEPSVDAGTAESGSSSSNSAAHRTAPEATPGNAAGADSAARSWEQRAAIWKSGARHLFFRARGLEESLKRQLNKRAELEAEIRRMRGEE